MSDPYFFEIENVSFLPRPLYAMAEKYVALEKARDEAQAAFCRFAEALPRAVFQYALDCGLLRSAEWEITGTRYISTENPEVVRLFSERIMHGFVVPHEGPLYEIGRSVILSSYKRCSRNCVHLEFPSTEVMQGYISEWGLKIIGHSEQKKLDELREQRDKLDAMINSLEMHIKNSGA